MANQISIAIQPQQIQVGITQAPAISFSINTKGADGRTIELRAGAVNIEWKYIDDTTWYPLVSIASITGYTPQKGVDYFDGDDGYTPQKNIDYFDGADGKQVELQNNGTYIQWRWVGDLAWTNLVALVDLKGDPGDPGVGIPNGGTTGQVLAKKTDANLDVEWVNQTGGGGGISEEEAIAYAIAL